MLRPVIHIGPPKTATSSLQEAVIPHLGRPFQIKPDWMRSLCRDDHFTPPVLPSNVIVSDERVGGFGRFSPAATAERLAQVFDRGVVVRVRRNPLDLFYSSYRQAIGNAALLLSQTTVPPGLQTSDGKPLPPNLPDKYFDFHLKQYRAHRCGFFAILDEAGIRRAFEPRFTVASLDFDLLGGDTGAFVSAFTDACGCADTVKPSFVHANRTDAATLEAELDAAPVSLPPALRTLYLNYYRHGRLSPDRADYLARLGRDDGLAALAKAFRFRRPE